MLQMAPVSLLAQISFVAPVSLVAPVSFVCVRVRVGVRVLVGFWNLKSHQNSLTTSLSFAYMGEIPRDCNICSTNNGAAWVNSCSGRIIFFFKYAYRKKYVHILTKISIIIFLRMQIGILDTAYILHVFTTNWITKLENRGW